MKTKTSFSSRKSGIGGAVFLMATAAIGPGFITQTTVFTQQLLTSFGFVILVSILLDIVVQLNIWRIMGGTGTDAVTLANSVLPGMGLLLTLLVAMGGLVFNIGNIGGCGLGTQVLFGIDVTTGALFSGLIAIIIFLYREFGRVMDVFTKLLGLVMIALTLFTAIKTHPPVADVLQHAVLPERLSLPAIITLVGGTVGGYISFAGANRMLDSFGPVKPSVRQVNIAAVNGILLAGVMRVLLYLAAIGVVASGAVLPAGNPAAGVFEASAGTIGLKIFGIVLWCAAITSVVGAAYTSVSFLQQLHPFIKANRQWFIIGFIALSTAIFSLTGNPVKILVQAGAINGFVLPLALTLMLLAIRSKKFGMSYKHPLWLTVCGWLVVLVITVMSARVIWGMW